jgi:glycosyltransferase involved in cell wall biosynthesis
MRILYHHRTLGDGAEGIHIREMVKAFRLIGHEVLVAGPIGEQLPTPTSAPSRLASLKQLMPSIVFELFEVAYSFYCFINLSIRAKVFRADFIYDRYITFNAGSFMAARWVKIPLVLEVNAPLAFERRSEPDERLYLKWLATAVERYVCSKADITLVVSTPLKEYLESVGVPVGKCIVMPNGVDQDKFKPMPKSQELINELQIPANFTVIGFLGILRPWHGLELLIEAVKCLKAEGRQIYLLIVGDGPIRANLEAALLEAGLIDCSRITGRVAHEKVSEYVNLFDIAVSPKATFYASPMKVVEYMALGKSVIAPDTASLRDMVDDSKNGILFVDNSISSLVTSIEKLCQSPQYREQLGNNAREKVVQRLNWKWNAHEVFSLITGLMGK